MKAKIYFDGGFADCPNADREPFIERLHDLLSEARDSTIVMNTGSLGQTIKTWAYLRGDINVEDL